MMLGQRFRPRTQCLTQRFGELDGIDVVGQQHGTGVRDAGTSSPASMQMAVGAGTRWSSGLTSSVIDASRYMLSL